MAVARAIEEAVDLNPRMSAVDVGGGTGRLSILLADRVGSVVVTDPSAGMVQVARERIEAAGLSDRLRAVQADLTTDRLDGAYDVVWSSMALHHVQDLDGLLRSVAGLLVDGGRLAIADLDEDPDGAFHAETGRLSTDITDSTGNASPSSWPAPASPTSASLTPRPSSRATASSACSCARRPRAHEPQRRSLCRTRRSARGQPRSRRRHRRTPWRHCGCGRLTRGATALIGLGWPDLLAAARGRRLRSCSGRSSLWIPGGRTVLLNVLPNLFRGRGGTPVQPRGCACLGSHMRIRIATATTAMRTSPVPTQQP